MGKEPSNQPFEKGDEQAKNSLSDTRSTYLGQSERNETMPQVLEQILNHLSEVIPFDSATFFLLDGEILRGVAAKNIPHPELVINCSFPADNALFAEMRKTLKPLILDDAQNDPRFQNWGGSDYVHSWMGIPLIINQKVIGYLTCDHTSVGNYSPSDAILAQAFANQAAIAIENTRLLDIEHKRLNELESIRQISLNLTSSLELPQVLNSILEATLSLLPQAQNSHIFLYNVEGKEELKFGAALWAEGLQKRPFSAPRPEGLTYTVARMGKLVVVPDMQNHPIFANAPKDWQGAIVGLPLLIGERVVGVMNISFHTPRNISDDELRLLNLLADQAAIAIENARLYEQVAREKSHLGLLYDINREISSNLDPDQILQSAITLTTQALGGLVGEAFLFLPEENRLSLRAIWGRKIESLEKLDAELDIKPGKGLVGWAAKTGRIIHSPNVTKDTRWQFIAGIDEGVLSAVSAAITSGDELLGAVSILHGDEDAFSSEQFYLLEAICREIALALRNAKSYQQAQRQLSEMTLIQNLTQTFTQRLEVKTLLDEIVNQLTGSLGYDYVSIDLFQNRQIVEHAERSLFETDLPNLSASEILKQVKETKSPIQRTEEGKLEISSKDPSISVEEIFVPILREEHTIGVIRVACGKTKSLSQQDLEILQVLSGQIAVALDNATLYEQVRNYAGQLEQTVEQRTAELSVLYQLSQQIGFSLSFEELLNILLSHLRKAIPCDVIIGCLAINERKLFYMDLQRPLSEHLLSTFLPEWLQNTTARFENPISLQECQLEMSWSEGFDEKAQELQRLDSIIAAPVFIQDECVGLLAIAHESANKFTDAQKQLVNTFANQASTSAQHINVLLAAQHKQLEKMVEHLPMGVLLLDTSHHILIANRRGKEYLKGLTGELLWTNKKLNKLGDVDIEHLLARENEPLPTEISMEGSPKRVFTVMVRSVSGPLESPTPTYLLAINEVTQERENLARIQIQERLATVGQLAAGIAHDFNNIMAAILVYTDLLRYDTSISPQSQEKLATIQQQVMRASSLIRQILDFSRKSVMEQSRWDLLPFLKELEKILRRILPETIQMEFSYHKGEYWINGDPTRLQQVFMNLATNARDAMPEGGKLGLELGKIRLVPMATPPMPQMPPGDYVRIAFSDTGGGIAPEIRKHIFEPFFTTKPVGQGTGLGLAQVYGIIKQHEGFIDFRSQVGKGTTFIIYLPAAREESTSGGQAEPFPGVEGQGRTVLIVEDDIATRQALQTLMDTQGYHTLTARNGVQALQLAESGSTPIELVITDIVMPEMGGMDLYEQLRERFPDIKVMFVTGHPLEEDIRTRLGEGKLHWLQKPFSVQDFNRAVLSLLEEDS